MNFLACDLGGTKVLLGIFEEEIDSVSVRSLDGKNLGIFNLNNLYKLMDELIEKRGRIG